MHYCMSYVSRATYYKLVRFWSFTFSIKTCTSNSIFNIVNGHQKSAQYLAFGRMAFKCPSRLYTGCSFVWQLFVRPVLIVKSPLTWLVLILKKKSNLKVVTKKLFTWFAGNKKKANRNIYHMFLADQKNLVLQSLVEQLSASVCVKIVDIKFKYNPMTRKHCQWYFEKGLLKFK